jgi:hypothetical protein
MNTANAGPSKKAYVQPNLRVYGGIQRLTEATTNMGANTDTRGLNMDLRTH